MALKINVALQQVLYVLRESAIPRRPDAVLKHPNRPVTGNMKYNATRIEHLGKNTSKVFVDENIAPYVPYTNEPWISPRWKGTKNPNEGWFDDFVEQYATLLAQALGGTLVKK